MRVVGGLVRTEPEPLGDLGVGRGEFRSQASDERQLPVVVSSRSSGIGIPFTSNDPVVRRSVESNATVPGPARPGASPRYESGSCDRWPQLDRGALR